MTSMTRDDSYYQAMRARDHRFDGKFFVGVKTTGIYCRPICPAKPKRENTEFFSNRFEAERRGYRPCLRCRPESAPRSPAWIGTSATVRRAVKILGTRDAIEFNELEFAEIFGVSARHLRRLFVDELGKTPKQIAFENRLGLARQLMIETNLPVSDVAFASGFGSVRRFNDAFRIRFKRRPSDVRRKRVLSRKGVTVTLAYRPPFDFLGLLRFYRNHRAGDLETFSNDSMERIFKLGDVVGSVAVSDDPVHSRLVVQIDHPDVAAIGLVVERLRFLFDLESDPIVIANAFECDRHLKRLYSKHVGLRLPSGWDPFESSIAVILGQLVSVERGRSLLSDLINLLGEDSGRRRDGRVVRLFPSADRIATSDLTALKTTGARKRTIQAFASSVASGALSLEPTQDVDTFVERVLEIPGIGPWTANMLAMRVLRHTDAFPDSDLILARALAIHSRETIERLSPWRGYAAILLWREYAQTLTTKKSTARDL